MNIDIIESLNALAKNQNLSQKVMKEILCESLVIATQKYLNLHKNIEVSIDEETGEIKVALCVKIVDDFPDPSEGATDEEIIKIDEKYMLLHDAKSFNNTVEVGDTLIINVPIEKFNRTVIITAKQMLLQRIRDAKREQIFEMYRKKQGTIISGTVQQVERGMIFVILPDNVEGVLLIREQIRKERYRQGESIRALILEVNLDTRHQIILSRSHPLFLTELFKLEVPEISNNTIRIRGASRDPGFRAKIAITTSDDRIDPVGACVGVKGNRVQAIVRELSNERIDVINWSDDLNTYIKRVLTPSNILDIHNIQDGRVIVIVNDEDLFQSIGRNGQNVRLASELVGRELDIYSKEEFEKMPEDEKTHIMTKIEGYQIIDLQSKFFPPETKEDKFSELESLFN